MTFRVGIKVVCISDKPWEIDGRIEKPTSISIFTAMLSPKKVEERV